MKKWMYVLGPGLMLAVFLFFYFASKSETDARLKEEKAHKEQVEKDAEAKKQAAEAKARADAEARNAQRTTDEAKIAKDKQDKYDSDMRRIKDDTDKASANAETYAKQVSELTIELDTLRKQKDTMTRDGFDLAKHVELAEVAQVARPGGGVGLLVGRDPPAVVLLDGGAGREVGALHRCSQADPGRRGCGREKCVGIALAHDRSRS